MATIWLKADPPLFSNAPYSYKAAGANATDETGALDTVEFINVAKDDALAWPERVHRAYPPTVDARMESTIKPFVRKSLAVNATLLNILNDRLGLPKGTLGARHTLEEPSGSEARTIKNPPKPGGISEAQAAIGAHTDFGSLASVQVIHFASEGVLTLVQSFLHNRLGGLQVMVPGTSEWQYVKVSCRVSNRMCNW